MVAIVGFSAGGDSINTACSTLEDFNQAPNPLDPLRRARRIDGMRQTPFSTQRALDLEPSDLNEIISLNT
jgi:hypothetical protein